MTKITSVLGGAGSLTALARDIGAILIIFGVSEMTEEDSGGATWFGQFCFASGEDVLIS